VGAHPEGIGSRVAESRPVCVGTISRGDFNNCSRVPEHVCVTFALGQDGLVRLCVLGACNKHVLAAKRFMLDTVSYDGEVLVTTPEGLEATLSEDEKRSMLHVVPAASA